MATLIVIGGPAEGQKFALEQHGLVMIGRDHTCTFQIVDPQISRRHVQVKRNSGSDGHLVIDFESANGVYLNDKRIDAHTPIDDGDVIHIGNTSIIYSVEDEPDAQTFTQLLRKHNQGRDETELPPPSTRSRS